MGRLKTLLERAPLREPSSALARRVAAALDEAETRSARPPWWRLSVPLWACVTAVVVGGLGGFAASRSVTERPPAIVYILPAEGELRRILMGEAEPKPVVPAKVEFRVMSREKL